MKKCTKSYFFISNLRSSVFPEFQLFFTEKFLEYFSFDHAEKRDLQLRNYSNQYDQKIFFFKGSVWLQLVRLTNPQTDRLQKTIERPFTGTANRPKVINRHEADMKQHTDSRIKDRPQKGRQTGMR
jgi:hypothetical protein